ncbi:acetylxylan esterase [Virgibacillus doumboii]|uniref:acetylxylan esterase n=1 Tax=Virgibacillus doumboii TaxID=2697503 RepID=UPI0013E0B249|nr:acetylxylan esterase [Virgibacillus doumboii]
MGRNAGDLPLDELRTYKPELVNKPESFDEFWDEQKRKINQISPEVSLKARDYPVPTVEVMDIVIESWDQTPIKGILVKPESVNECPVIVSYHSYTGYRGLPADYIKWLTLGAAVVAFDIRGQGDSPDFANYPNGSRVPGWMLHDILDADNYYYTNVYRDLILQLNWIKSLDFPVKPTKIGVMGSSQGGGIAIAAAGLNNDIDFCIADWPFLSHFERALYVARSGSYLEILNYFKFNDPQNKTYDQVMNTLGYIDSVHFSESITCPTLMAIGLEDDKTPPSTVFAVYNHLQTDDKQIEVYPQFGHEVNPFHEEKKVAFVASQLER